MAMTDIETTDELKHDRDLQRRGVKIDDAIRGLTDEERMALINKSLRKVGSALSAAGREGHHAADVAALRRPIQIEIGHSYPPHSPLPRVKNSLAKAVGPTFGATGIAGAMMENDAGNSAGDALRADQADAAVALAR